MSTNPTVLANLLASKFIQRKDVKAAQGTNGYYPVKKNDEYVPWSRADLESHVAGTKSFGHYLVDADAQCKLFAFDIDLTKWDEKTGREKPTWLPIDEDGYTVDTEPKPVVPREAWLHPKAPPELRRFLIAQLRGIADLLATITDDVLEIPVAVSYSGNKGLHVYGFTGAASAHDVRGAALEVVSIAGCFETFRGNNFFLHQDDDPRTGFGCIDLEVYPKQSEIDKDGLGNLMRLPLGKNLKSGQDAHFITLSSPVETLVEMNPVTAMEGGNPWDK